MAIKGGEAVGKLRVMWPKQLEYVMCGAKRIMVKGGRRSSKTLATAERAVIRFSKGRRELYAAPTGEQTEKFWYEVCRALEGPILGGQFKKNDTEKVIEKEGTEQRIKAKTAWNADMLRGDWADDLYLDEYQLMDEDVWEVVGQPMLLDGDGDACFLFTPPSLREGGVSKARDPLHAVKLYRKAMADKSGVWKAFHWKTQDNPMITEEALGLITVGMSREAYRREILAEDEEVSPSQLVYGAFQERTQVIEGFPIPVGWPRYTGHDFGSANPAALFVAQDPGTGYFYIYEEYRPREGRGTAQNVEAFKEMVAGVNVLKRLGGSHQEEEVRQGYTAHGWPIYEPSVKGVNPQIDRVKGLMELNKVFIFRSCRETLEEMVNYLWKQAPDGAITDEVRDGAKFHLMACLRYVLSDFVPQTVHQVGWEVVDWGRQAQRSRELAVSTNQSGWKAFRW